MQMLFNSKLLLFYAFLGIGIFSSCSKKNLSVSGDYLLGNADTIYVDSSSKPAPTASIDPVSGEEGRIITINTKHFDTTNTDYEITFNGNKVDILSDTLNKLTFQIPEGTQPGSYEIKIVKDTTTLTESFTVVPYNTTGKPKVLLFGIDGLQYEKIADVNTPNLDKLNTTKAFTGGITGTATEQATWSGAGWMSVLNGTWVDKHTVNGNSTDTYHDQSKSVFTYIRENMPDAYTTSIITWQPIHILQGTQMNNVDYKWYGDWVRGNKIDSIGVDIAVNQIINKGPDFIFDYIVNVDDLAHQDGFGTTYDEAIKIADRQLGKLMDAIKKRKQTHDENWLIIVVTDHGRQSNGYSHGNQSTSEKTIFISMNKEGNDYFKTHNTDIPNHDFDNLYGYPEQTSVTPTILRYLGINQQDDWGFASPPLIGKDGPRNLMFADAIHKKLYWKSTSSSNAIIYKNGQKIDEVPASQDGYTDETNDEDYIGSDGIITYTVSIDGSTGYISTKAMVKPGVTISDVLPWTDNKTIFPFRSDGLYDKFYMDSRTMSTQYNGYPTEVTSGSWASAIADSKEHILAIVRWGDNAYFFLDDATYIKYNVASDSYVAGPSPVNNHNWPGMEDYGQKISAAVEWGSDLMFFLNDGTYIKYQKSGPEGALSGYPKNVADNWSGITTEEAKKITAVFVDPTDSNVAYFFLTDNTYIKYDISADKAESGYPKPLTDGNWPGLLAY